MAEKLELPEEHLNQLQSLFSALKDNKLASTFLFVGPQGVGKERVGLALTQALLCEQDQLSCGRCMNCQKILAKESEHLLVIEPEKGQIKVAQARQVLDFFHLQKISKARVVLINQANTMNTQAANTLLKVIEEPPEGSYIILTTSSLVSMLPTIRSRSQVVHFSQLSIESLKEFEPSAAEWAYRSARGSLNQLKFFMREEISELRSRAFESFSNLLTLRPNELFESIKLEIKDKENAETLILFWQQIVRDLILIDCNQSSAICHTDHLSFYQEYGQHSQQMWHCVYDQLIELERSLKSNFDRGLCFENLFYNMTDIKEKHAGIN